MSELYFTLLFTLLFFRELLTLTNMRLKKMIPLFPSWPLKKNSHPYTRKNVFLVLSMCFHKIFIICPYSTLVVFFDNQSALVNRIRNLEVVARWCSVKKVFLEISRNSQESTCARVFFNKDAGLWHRCFPVNFAKFLRTPFLQNTSGGWLLL